ncbi:hypothetical protein IMG5_185570 [Ichthyophthirius multifiliis]|uniref:Uncharacterized protein n=1 Tax=Ichthyophthirius multifiliis TaxID=5932 RepID=G0R3I5_ICHMU|nr:hypothetical protein IMG5_185570 [Ichthyophthirius multifiliis]EGR27974.1 hypothetical protein IMG5_185570 [Ichthyophthirius multifiliis]|eukprot:XP_004027319.1 hypothetical protein IMG5_185570 [Ichthyophthirius multifiliis]
MNNIKIFQKFIVYGIYAKSFLLIKKQLLTIQIYNIKDSKKAKMTITNGQKQQKVPKNKKKLLIMYRIDREIKNNKEESKITKNNLKRNTKKQIMETLETIEIMKTIKKIDNQEKDNKKIIIIQDKEEFIIQE